MAAPYYSLLDKASNALALYLRGEIPASASIIHPSKRALEKTPPCVVCEADNATSEILYSGRYIIDAVVTVSMVAASDVPESESGSDAAVSDSSELVGSVFDSLLQPFLDSLVHSVLDVHVVSAHAMQEG